MEKEHPPFHFNRESSFVGQALIAAMLVVSGTNANAQTTTAFASANIVVKGLVSLSALRNLELGTVVQGITQIQVNPITGGGSAAYFTFASSPHTPIIVTFSSTRLTFDGNSIEFSGELAGSPSPVQAQSIIIKNGNGLVTNAKGQYHFWVGGSAKLSPDQPLGFYTGNFTMTIAY